VPAKSVFPLVPLLALLAVPASSTSSGTDGVWTLREHYCITIDRKTRCGRGSEQYMFVDETAYYRGDPSEEWTEAGIVGRDGRRVRVDIDEAGFETLVASRTGIDVSEYVQTFAMSYTGKLQGSRIVNGHVRADASLDVEGTSHVLRARGGFTARRLGDPETISSGDGLTLRPSLAGRSFGVASAIAMQATTRQ
jgi:hypothetical protein